MSNLDKNAQFEKGRKIRSEVLGKERVDNSLALAEEDDFMAPFQQAATEWGWGMVWGRGVLSRQTRSMLSVCMLATLDKPTELKHHIEGALNNGCTKEEIREVLMHVCCYAGMPAGLSAARAAKEFFDEHES